MSDTGVGMYIALIVGGLATSVLAFFVIKFIIYTLNFLFTKKQKK